MNDSRAERSCLSLRLRDLTSAGWHRSRSESDWCISPGVWLTTRHESAGGLQVFNETPKQYGFIYCLEFIMTNCTYAQ